MTKLVIEVGSRVRYDNGQGTAFTGSIAEFRAQDVVIREGDNEWRVAPTELWGGSMSLEIGGQWQPIVRR